MATKQELLTLISEIEVKVMVLKDQAANSSGMTLAETEEVKASLVNLSSVLDGNSVPVEP